MSHCIKLKLSHIIYTKPH